LRSRARVLGLLFTLTPSTLLADWLSELGLGSELGGSGMLYWSIEKRDLPITHRLSLDYLKQSGDDQYALTYRTQFNVSHSFYHFARLHTGANPAAGIERTQTALIASANSPYRGRASRLSIEFGGGFQRLAIAGDLPAADSVDETKPVLMFASSGSVKPGERFRLQLDLLALRSDESIDLTTTLAGQLQLDKRTTLQLNYRVHQIDKHRSSTIRDERLTLSVSYQFDWMPASKRWPDT
jgi:hypothetical protein